MSERLLPCPFCGGMPMRDKQLRDGCADGEPDAWAYLVRCRACACEGPWFKTRGNADDAWNRRHQPDSPNTNIGGNSE
jgi:Lar family restriction alleviation protein